MKNGKKLYFVGTTDPSGIGYIHMFALQDRKEVRKSSSTVTTGGSYKGTCFLNTSTYKAARTHWLGMMMGELLQLFL
ncbi:hypothetical protein OH492_20640 [Vibrio chagasii]|nr:hypothetical protein [Vibrio chagasii]